MPKQLVEDSLWKKRLDFADKYYKQWANLFKCDVLEKYYEGQQWKSQRELGYNPYVVNKVYETIQIKLAQFVPTFPKFQVSAKPSAAEWGLEAAARSATLKEDVLNTLVSNEGIHFHQEVENAYKDSFFRFGMFQVGYAAEWILNPNANKPLFKSQSEKFVHVDGSKKPKVKREPDELPTQERIFFKHVSAKRFRVGGVDHQYLERCSWIGYYEYAYKEDLLALNIINRDKIQSIDGEHDEPEANDRNTEGTPHDTCKVWHIWDLRSRMQLLLLNSPCITIYQRRFKRLPLFDFRPDRRTTTEGFYPVPPAFQWISCQDEINEIREMLRTHRRRFVRKFQVQKGFIDDTEIEKFETGPDGALIITNQPDAIKPIDNADLGQALQIDLQVSADDLNRISGTTNEDRGIADRTTATQANLINTRTQLREQSDRDAVVFWLSQIGREALLTARDKFALGMWARLTQPEGENLLGSVQIDQNPAYKWISQEDLNDGYDYKIDVDVTSISVASQQDEKRKFIEFLGVLTQFPMLAFSPLLVREAAYRIGYRNEKAIKELQNMALLMELGRQRQLQAQAGMQQLQPSGGQPGQAAQQIVAQQTPPDMEQIRQQLTNQVGGGGQVQ